MPPIIPQRPNPVRSALPDGVRKVVDFIFPEDDPFAGLSPTPLSVVNGPSQGLLKALQPMAHGAIERGQALAEALSGRAKNIMPTVWLDGILSGKPAAIDPSKLISVDRFTGSRPPASAPIESSYAGMMFKNPNNSRRADPVVEKLEQAKAPQLSALRAVWDKFVGSGPKVDRSPRSTKAVSQGERPALSGKWNTDKARGSGYIRNPKAK